jgi:hypothetical protein
MNTKTEICTVQTSLRQTIKQNQRLIAIVLNEGNKKTDINFTI